MSNGSLFCGVEGSARFREPLPDASFFSVKQEATFSTQKGMGRGFEKSGESLEKLLTELAKDKEKD